MTRQKALPAKADAPPPAATATDDETRHLKIAQALIRPSTLAANTISTLRLAGDQADVVSLTVALREQQALVSKGDLSRAEGMLIAQAHTLDALFCKLTHRATLNMGEYLDAAERYMRLALRAQAQCARTLETLATVKNPPVLIAKQANIANGPQQVNNGIAPAAEPLRAGETENPQNRLLEQDHGEHRLDTGTASAASGADPAMAALGESDRAEVRRR
jgi:hypothetical protein